MKAKTTQGFTIVELLIAISVMGIMSALTTAVVVSTIRFYAFTNNFRQNQQAGRNILDTITTDTRFGELITVTPVTTDSLCVRFRGDNNKTLFYKWNPFTKNLIRFINYTNSCTSTGAFTKLNPDTMQVSQFVVQEVKPPLGGGNVTSVVISLEFVTGGSGANCPATNIYCNKSILTTAITLDEDL